MKNNVMPRNDSFKTENHKSRLGTDVNDPVEEQIHCEEKTARAIPLNIRQGTESMYKQKCLHLL